MDAELQEGSKTRSFEVPTDCVSRFLISARLNPQAGLCRPIPAIQMREIVTSFAHTVCLLKVLWTEGKVMPSNDHRDKRVNEPPTSVSPRQQGTQVLFRLPAAVPIAAPPSLCSSLPLVAVCRAAHCRDAGTFSTPPPPPPPALHLVGFPSFVFWVYQATLSL